MESKKELTGLEALEVMLGYASFNERYYEHKGEDPYAVIKKDLDKLEKLKKLEKELKQTKLNFKNSQIHSKNAYKRLKEKYGKLEERHKECYARNFEVIIENTKLKKVIEILKYTNVNWVELKFSSNVTVYNTVVQNSDFDELTQKEYELLKEVFENDQK